MIFDTGRTVLIENLGSIFKHPKAWCRLRCREPLIVSPLDSSTVDPSSGSGLSAAERSAKPPNGAEAGQMSGIDSQNYGRDLGSSVSVASGFPKDSCTPGSFDYGAIDSPNKKLDFQSPSVDLPTCRSPPGLDSIVSPSALSDSRLDLSTTVAGLPSEIPSGSLEVRPPAVESPSLSSHFPRIPPRAESSDLPASVEDYISRPRQCRKSPRLPPTVEYAQLPRPDSTPLPPLDSTLVTKKGVIRRGSSLTKSIARMSKSPSESSSPPKDTHIATGSMLFFPIFCSSIFIAENSWSYNWFLENRISTQMGSLDHFPFPLDRWNQDQMIYLSSPLCSEESPDQPQDCTAAPNEFSGADLSRLPPRRYLASLPAQQAIRKEVFGLLKGRIGQVPPLEIVDSQHEQFIKGPCYPMTLIVRVKPNNQVKARLCVRGDCVGGHQRFFMSSPTADRSLIRILLSVASNLSFDVVICDISQAFLQADVLPIADRFYAIPPPCIKFSPREWGGEILTTPPPAKTISNRYLFRCNRPIYGSTDAPLRWYVTLASRLRKFRYHPHRTDLCFFSRRCPDSGVIVALIIVHVDDLVMAGSPQEIEAFTTFIDTFVHGPIEYVTEKEPIMYCGLSIIKRKVVWNVAWPLSVEYSCSTRSGFYRKSGEVLERRRYQARSETIFGWINLVNANQI